MPRNTVGKIQFSTQIPEEVVERFREYASQRGESMSAVCERAMRREMANPPPVLVPPPLPPMAVSGEQVKPRGRPRKQK